MTDEKCTDHNACRAEINNLKEQNKCINDWIKSVDDRAQKTNVRVERHQEAFIAVQNKMVDIHTQITRELSEFRVRLDNLVMARDNEKVSKIEWARFIATIGGGIIFVYWLFSTKGGT